MPINNELISINPDVFIQELRDAGTGQVKEILLAGKYEEPYIDLAVRFLVDSGKVSLSPEDLRKMASITVQSYGNKTLAHIFGRRGYRLSIEELLSIGNPKDVCGWTVAHEMAMCGYDFNQTEINELGNPVDAYERTLVHVMARRGRFYSLDELLLMKNLLDIYDNTVAHCMALSGHVFTVTEILALGNPASKVFYGIADILVWDRFVDVDDKEYSPVLTEGVWRRVSYEDNRIIHLLIYDEDGNPYFSNNVERGKEIRRFTCSSTIFKSDFPAFLSFYNTRNQIQYEIKNPNGGWMVELTHNSDPLRGLDTFNYLYQKKVTMEYAKKLTAVIQSHQEFNMSAYEKSPEFFVKIK